MRFDEIELEAVPLGGVDESPAAAAVPLPDVLPDATWFRRTLALLTDLSLFAALTLALSPLLPASRDWMSVAALAGFVLVLSYYYLVGTWLLWGKSIGGAIFDVKVVADGREAMSLRGATLRWVGLLLSLAMGGLGLLVGLPGRLSRTKCVVG